MFKNKGFNIVKDKKNPNSKIWSRAIL
jgi:hypothetical protein